MSFLVSYSLKNIDSVPQVHMPSWLGRCGLRRGYKGVHVLSLPQRGTLCGVWHPRGVLLHLPSFLYRLPLRTPLRPLRPASQPLPARLGLPCALRRNRSLCLPSRWDIATRLHPSCWPAHCGWDLCLSFTGLSTLSYICTAAACCKSSL